MTTAEKLVKVAENVPKVYKAGQKSEYDRFWDAFQDNGAVIRGAYLFSGNAWNDNTYNPKRTIKVSTCTNMYRSCLITDTKVDVDVSNATGTYAFNDAANLINIRKLIVSENVAYTGWFAYCSALVEIRFEGVIGKSLDIHYSTKLSAESYYSIITALSSSVSGQKFIVPPTAEATYNANPPQGDGIPQTWAELIGTKSNWTIAEP